MTALIRRAALVVALSCAGCGPRPGALECVAQHPAGESEARLGLFDCANSSTCLSKCQSTQWSSGVERVTEACARCVADAVTAKSCMSHCSTASDCAAMLACMR